DGDPDRINLVYLEPMDGETLTVQDAITLWGIPTGQFSGTCSDQLILYFSNNVKVYVLAGYWYYENFSAKLDIHRLLDKPVNTIEFVSTSASQYDLSTPWQGVFKNKEWGITQESYYENYCIMGT